MKKPTSSDLSAVWGRGSGQRTGDVLLPDESDRWLALMLGRSAYDLLAAPLRYGPLTVEGYFSARQSTLLAGARGWPTRPEEIARIFAVCGLTAGDAVPAVTRHFQGTGSAADPEGALCTLLALGCQFGISFTVDDAVTVLRGIGHKSDRSSVDLDAILGAANAFMTNSKDEDDFFRGWMQQLKVSHRHYGSGSLCTMAVWHLALADSSLLSGWCVENQDYQALALMVHQGRLSFCDWIRMVATSRDIPVIARSERVADSASHREAQFGEQYRALHYLAALLSPEVLKAGASDLAMTYPHLVDVLLRMAPEPGTKFDAWLGWTLPWVQMGLCSASHPIVVDQLAVAQATVTNAIEQGARDVWHTGMAPIEKDAMVDASWLRFVAPKLAALSLPVKNLLAQRLLIGLSAKNVEDVLDTFGIVHETWFSDADLGHAVQMRREHTVGSGGATEFDVNIALLPWLNKRYWPAIGAQLAQACDNGKIAAKTVRARWKSYLPKVFGAPIPSEYQASELVLFALTRSDPRSLRGALGALGCMRSSDEYRSCVEDWIAGALNVGPVAEPLPKLTL